MSAITLYKVARWAFWLIGSVMLFAPKDYWVVALPYPGEMAVTLIGTAVCLALGLRVGLLEVAARDGADD